MESAKDFIDKIEDRADGYFLIEEKDGFAVLRVFPPGKKGVATKARDVISRLNLFGLKGFDSSIVEEITLNADTNEYPICKWNQPDPIDAKIQVEILGDKMSAELVYHPPFFGGSVFYRASLEAELNRQNVHKGLIESAIELILKENQGRHKLTIARGEYPSSGKPETYQFNFDLSPSRRPSIIGDTVDFRRIHIIQSCKKGEILAEKIEAIPGKDGFTVEGEVIRAEVPSSVVAFPGKNTRWIDGETKIVADIDGQIRFTREEYRSTIEVEEVLELDNVDFSTGHIEYPGTVHVNERILDGFRITAGGDIYIHKTAGHVFLKAKGSVYLEGGLVSKGDACVESGNTIYARFVQGARLIAQNGIFIEEASIHSDLTSGGDICVDTGRGELIGGECICSKMIRAKKIGAKMETETRITLGLDLEMFEKLRLLEIDFEEKRETLSKVKTHLTKLTELKDRNRLSADDAETLAKLGVLLQNYELQIQNLAKQRSLLHGSVKPNPESVAIATEMIYPNVEISFGTGLRRYRSGSRGNFRYTEIRFQSGEIAESHKNPRRDE